MDVPIAMLIHREVHAYMQAVLTASHTKTDRGPVTYRYINARPATCQIGKTMRSHMDTDR